MKTILYLARHGETQENVAGILQGHLPGTLTEVGKGQAEGLLRTLQGLPRPDVLLTSDLGRAIETGSIMNAGLDLPVEQTALLRERDWGSLTGRPINDVDKKNFPEDVESLEAMYARARQFLLHVEGRYEGKTVLAVGHGLFNRCIQAVLRGVTLREVPRMQNAEVRRLELDENLSAFFDTEEVGATAD